MSGHSKWAKVKRIKEVRDVKKAAILSKASKDIITAVQVGGSSDEAFNPMLRVALNFAKSINLPKDRIEKAISKGSGKTTQEDIVVSRTYELIGLYGVNALVESETDNVNRTISEIRSIAQKNSFKVVPEGSISWKFRERGVIEFTVINKNNLSEIELGLYGIPGIEDFAIEELEVKLYCQKVELIGISRAITSVFQNEVVINSINLAKIPVEKVELSDLEKEEVVKALEDFFNHAETLAIYTNIKDLESL